jgi:hypothetical protein
MATANSGLNGGDRNKVYMDGFFKKASLKKNAG